jgi:hypothetical protein
LINREKAGESVANNNLDAPAGDPSDDDYKPTKQSGGGFAALMAEDGGAAEEDEDFGGLMVRTMILKYYPKLTLY